MINTEHELNSGFRDAVSEIIEASPTKFSQNHQALKYSWLDTKLGSMVAISDEVGLYLLEFIGTRGLEREISRFKLNVKLPIVLGMADPIKSITLELQSYFDGVLKEFKTPLHLLGSPFQRVVWEELRRIPYGQTRSYAAQAEAIGKPTAYRAVANANGANKMAIVIPCHRIISSDGGLGGYAGGVDRKQWLLDHERRK